MNESTKISKARQTLKILKEVSKINFNTNKTVDSVKLL